MATTYEQLLAEYEKMVPDRLHAILAQFRQSVSEDQARLVEVKGEGYRGYVERRIKSTNLRIEAIMARLAQEAQTLEAALNNEDEAEAIATNDQGITVEVTYYSYPMGKSPYKLQGWIWKESSLSVGSDDTHMTVNVDQMRSRIFTNYGLDPDAPIWTRKQPELIEK